MKCMEYVEREAVLAEYDKQHEGPPGRARKIIETFPAADVVERKRGTWYGSGDGYADGHLVIDEWECPCCGKYFPEWDEKPDWNYCPNCGADMRGE